MEDRESKIANESASAPSLSTQTSTSSVESHSALSSSLSLRAEGSTLSQDSALRTQDFSFLLEFLRDRDWPCPQCRYNLRGLTSPRCPECGQFLQLSVGLVEPYLRTWLALASITVASSGIGLFILCIVLKAGLPRGPSESWLRLTLILFMVSIPFGPLVLLSRRRMLRLERRTQWAVVAIAGALFACAMALFIFVLH